jgi:hypothetical protein
VQLLQRAGQLEAAEAALADALPTLDGRAEALALAWLAQLRRGVIRH